MNIKMENQRDWIHIVTDYYAEGSFYDYISKQGKIMEYEIA